MNRRSAKPITPGELKISEAKPWAEEPHKTGMQYMVDEYTTKKQLPKRLI